MDNLFLVWIVNLYMFRRYLGPSSGGTTVCIQHLVFIIRLDDCLLSWLDSNPTTTTDKQEYTKNKLCIIFFTRLLRLCCTKLFMLIWIDSCRSQWLRGLRRRSAAARLLRSWVGIPLRHGCLSVVSVVCCQVEVSATSWSLVQRSPTDCSSL
jgi:hypothetical protein